MGVWCTADGFAGVVSFRGPRDPGIGGHEHASAWQIKCPLPAGCDSSAVCAGQSRGETRLGRRKPVAQRMEEMCNDAPVRDDGYESVDSDETEDEFDDNQYGTMVCMTYTLFLVYTQEYTVE